MKIIAGDYDGTLSYGGIDDKKREAIKKWRETGKMFAQILLTIWKKLFIIVL